MVVASSAGLAAGVVAVAISSARLEGNPLLLQYQEPWLGIVAATVLLLAVANAFTEELLWRLALWRIPAGRGDAFLVLTTQATSFGVAHINGIPGGLFGVAAAAVYSVIVSGVRLRWGFPAALTVHLATDLVVFGAVASHVVYLPA